MNHNVRRYVQGSIQRKDFNMRNEEFETYINHVIETAKQILTKPVFAITCGNCDMDPISCKQKNCKEGSVIDEISIDTVCLYHLQKKEHDTLIDRCVDTSVKGYSFRLSGNLREDLGEAVFCDRETIQAAFDEKTYTLDEETKSLISMFDDLEAYRKTPVDRTVFCVLRTNETEDDQTLYEVCVMKVINVIITSRIGQYDSYINDRAKMERDGYIVVFHLLDTAGGATKVLGQQCFLDSEEAFAKAEELNKGKRY